MVGNSETVIPVVEERVEIKRRPIATGRVKIDTRTETVDKLVSADLKTESVSVSRIAIGREIDRAPEIRTEGDVTIVPIVEEVLVVEKRLVLKEELHITRNVSIDKVEVPVSVRRQTGTVTREEPPKEDEEQDNG